MKESLKKVLYFICSLLFRLPLVGLANFFIKMGYVIKGESLYQQSKVTTFENRIEMHNYFAREMYGNEEILYMEFGVFRGNTFFIWERNNSCENSGFWGFDTFTGLPEKWGIWKKGSFSTEGKVPATDDKRSTFFPGLIQDTLPTVLDKVDSKLRKIIHIDVDIYSATLYTLVSLAPKLNKGDLIIFDDFFTFTVSDHEFKAFDDFFISYNVKYKPLAKCRRGHFVLEIC